MGRVIATIFAVLGLLATLAAASTAAGGLGALGGGFAGAFAFAALIIIAGVIWLLSVVFFVIAFIGSRDVRSTIIAVLMLVAAVANFLAGFTAFSLSLGDGALTPLGQLYAGGVGALLVVWGLLLTVMGLRRR